MKRILSALLSIALMAMFYVFAVLQQDEEPQENMRWLVQEEKEPLKAIGKVSSTDVQTLANAFGESLPAPDAVLEGVCFDASYKGEKAHMLNISGNGIAIQGVTPSFASPLIRNDKLKLTEEDSALFGFKLLKADNENYDEYYIVTQNAAFSFKLAKGETEPLNNLRLIQPDI